MSFTTRIKEEVSSITSSKTEMVAELSGYMRNNGTINKKAITMTTESKCIVERVKNAMESLYNVSVKVSTIDNLNFSKNTLYQIEVNLENNILTNLGIFDEQNKYLETVPNYIIGANEEIRSYLRGVFLGVGSINDPKTSKYHMELMITQPKEAVLIQKLLNIFDLNAKILNREKGYMIYIKEAEKISDFIRIIGANNAVLYFENIRVYRDQKNKTNRLNNCEQANTDKIIQTASEQLKNIEIIEQNDGLVLLDDKVREVVEYRKKYPESSLKELAEIISMETNKSITKSGLNHRFRKIKELAENFKKMSQKQ